jgi:nicotinate phosphoribosyltransferase
MIHWHQYEPTLVTDLYEITMAASYFHEGKRGEATFSMYIRDCPPVRGYFVAAGLESFLNILENFRFSDDAIDYLRSLGRFSEDFLNYLKGFRFSGSVRALPEGTIFFPYEPLIEVTAPIIESQILESLVMNIFHIETLIASKAARCVEVAGGRGLVDFSLRRTHGVDAAVKVARSSYLVGFMGTSNLMAGKLYGIPVFGTMAHSYIMSFEHEIDAFYAYARTFPESTVLLLDTYDTVKAAYKAVEVAKWLQERGMKLRGVRLDSGDLVELSHRVKEIFRANGLDEVAIMASGSLDEYSLHKLLNSGAYIDVVGIGTKMGVSADVPYLDLAYKLVEYEGKPVLKLSPGKRSLVSPKQVFRYYNSDGMMSHDVLTTAWDRSEKGEPLLVEVVRDGRIVRKPEGLGEIRARFQDQYSRLPAGLKELEPAERYNVVIGSQLLELEEKTAAAKRVES